MSQELHNGIAIYYVAGTLFVLLLISAIVFYVLLHQKKVNAFRFKLQQEEIKKQEAIFSAIQEGEEKERNRIAEELHDGISARLAGITMNLDYIISIILEEENKEIIQKTYSGINEIINDLRDISHNMQPIASQENNLQASLSNYIEQLNAKNKCSYSLYFEGNAELLNEVLKLHCYRIIIELLYNIYKHAEATNATVQVIIEEGKIQIIIEDNGKGFKLDANKKGIGLSNIQNRVNINNGNMNIDSSEIGTTIIIELPI